MKDQAEQTRQQDHVSWGLVELQVTDLPRAAAFWSDAFGIRIRSQDAASVHLGTQGRSLVVLHAGAQHPAQPQYTGLYHVAIGVPDQAEFSRILARLLARDVPVAPTDHLASKSVYITDPDGLEIEIVYETPHRFSHFGDMSGMPVLYGVDGAPHTGRAPLDVAAELRHSAGADLDAPLSDKAFLAHLHFRVGALDAASGWFAQLGFDPNLMLSDWGFADMSAGGGTSHRLAMNVWGGKNTPPAPQGMARMIGYALNIHAPHVEQAARALPAFGGGLSGTDITGTPIALIPSYAHAEPTGATL